MGSLFQTPDEGARAFAEKFYEALLAGKPAGEAMRLARKNVMSKKQYAAAWACYVMYGDPCLRMSLDRDELQEALAEMNLSRIDFDPSCLLVLERAFEFGRQSGGIGTPHLFAAMVGGENPHLRDSLLKQGIPPDRLRDAFREVFRGVGGRRPKAVKSRAFYPVTSDLGRMLKKSSAKRRSGRGMAGGGGSGDWTLCGGSCGSAAAGEAGEILRSVGVDLDTLDPDYQPKPVGTPAGGRGGAPRGGGL